LFGKKAGLIKAATGKGGAGRRVTEQGRDRLKTLYGNSGHRQEHLGERCGVAIPAFSAGGALF
jgi:hypothetical protein